MPEPKAPALPALPAGPSGLSLVLEMDFEGRLSLVVEPSGWDWTPVPPGTLPEAMAAGLGKVGFEADWDGRLRLPVSDGEDIPGLIFRTHFLSGSTLEVPQTSDGLPHHPRLTGRLETVPGWLSDAVRGMSADAVTRAIVLPSGSGKEGGARGLALELALEGYLRWPASNVLARAAAWAPEGEKAIADRLRHAAAAEDHRRAMRRHGARAALDAGRLPVTSGDGPPAWEPQPADTLRGFLSRPGQSDRCGPWNVAAAVLGAGAQGFKWMRFDDPAALAARHPHALVFGDGLAVEDARRLDLLQVRFLLRTPPWHALHRMAEEKRQAAEAALREMDGPAPDLERMEGVLLSQYARGKALLRTALFGPLDAGPDFVRSLDGLPGWMLADPGDPLSTAVARWRERRQEGKDGHESQAAPHGPAGTEDGEGLGAGPVAADGDGDAGEDPGPRKPRKKHVDAGEKIGMARKDLYGVYLTDEQIKAMDAPELLTLAEKARIWPSYDFKKLKEEGVPLEVCCALKLLKDSIQPRPGLSRARNTEEDLREYIREVSRLRDQMEGVRSKDGLKEAMCGVDENRQTMLVWRSFKFRDHYSLTWGAKCLADKKGWAAVIAERPASGNSPSEKIEVRPHLADIRREGPDWREGRDIDAGDLMKRFGFRAVEFGNWLPQDERQAVLNHAYDAFSDLADVLGLPDRAMGLGGQLAVAFGSRGKSRAAAHYEPVRKVINLTRLSGAGSLAHEWGHALDNWLGGQENPNDTLGTTMMTGAVKPGKRGYRTDPRVNAPRQLHNMLHDGLVFGKLTFDEVRERVAKTMESAVAAVSRAMQRSLENGMGGKLDATASAHLLPTFKSDVTLLAGRLAEAGPVAAAPRNGHERSLFIDKMASTFAGRLDEEGVRRAEKEMAVSHFVQTISTKEGLAGTWRAAAQAWRLADLDRHGEQSEIFTAINSENRFSGYYTNAMRLDNNRSGYYARLEELFARAFESRVFDKVAQAGRRSDYLVHGVEEDRYADHPRGNPYPAGLDRRLLAGHIDSLVAEFGKRLEAAMEAEAANKMAADNSENAESSDCCLT